MDRSGRTAIAIAIIVALTIAIVAAYRARARAHRKSRYCPGPNNVGLYDKPYKNYPTYEGRGATWWDGDRRCAAFCQQSPCAVWCR